MKLFTLTTGLIALVVGLVFAVWGGWIAYWHYAALSTGRSAEFVNPLLQLSGGVALLLLAGFLIGYSVGRPRKVVEVPVEA